VTADLQMPSTLALNIRPARPQELSELSSLASQPPAWVRYVLRLQTRQEIAVFVAESEGQLAGFIVVRVTGQGVPKDGSRFSRALSRLLYVRDPGSQMILQPTRLGVIDYIYVAPVLRRQSIGGGLARRGIKWLDSQSVDDIRVTMHPDDENGRRFFEELSFEPLHYLVSRKL